MKPNPALNTGAGWFHVSHSQKEGFIGMSGQHRLMRSIYCSAVVALVLSLSGCAADPANQRIDNIPMYGQPHIPRPEVLKKADEEFIKEASSGFGGSREAASRAWWAQAEKFMSQGNMDYAMRRYNQSWLLNPSNYQPYWGFARVMLERDKMDEAIVYLETAKKFCDDPYQKVALLSDMGTAYSYKAASIPEDMREERARYFSLANQHFEEATKLDAQYANAWLRWSHSLSREGKYAEAWEKLKTARANGAQISEVYLRNLSANMPEPK